MTRRLLRRLYDVLTSAGVRFLIVGGAATAVTIGVFNLLVHTGSHPVLAAHPIPAYGGALVVGLVVNYGGNRFWAFAAPPPASTMRQIAAFVLVNAVAFAIPAGCLGISRYVLGFDSTLADNVSANVIGLIVATAARWWLYRRVVFAHPS